jgi:hypothetical protein
LPRHIEPEPGQSKLKAFKDRIKTSVVRDTFTTPEDLAYKVAASLGRFLIVKAELEDIPRSNDVSTEHGRDQVARRAARLQPIIRGGRVLVVNDFPAEIARDQYPACSRRRGTSGNDLRRGDVTVWAESV